MVTDRYKNITHFIKNQAHHSLIAQRVELNHTICLDMTDDVKKSATLPFQLLLSFVRNGTWQVAGVLTVVEKNLMF